MSDEGLAVVAGCAHAPSALVTALMIVSWRVMQVIAAREESGVNAGRTRGETADSNRRTR